MPDDPRPLRWCENTACSLRDVKVRTRTEQCVTCKRPLHDDTDKPFQSVSEVIDELLRMRGR